MSQSQKVQPLFGPGRHSPGRHAAANFDFTVVSHGPDHAVLTPRSARADRFLDWYVSADCDEESWCDGGLRIEWPALKGMIETIRGLDLVIEE